MFQSTNGKNLLFKDSTKCLQKVESGTTAEQFLGEGYVNAMKSLRQCADITPGLYCRGYKHLHMTATSNVVRRWILNFSFIFRFNFQQNWRDPALSILVNKRTRGDQECMVHNPFQADSHQTLKSPIHLFLEMQWNTEL